MENKNKTTNIILTIGILGLLVLLFSLFPVMNPDSENKLREMAVEAVEDYRSALSEQDLDKIESLSYRLSDTCKDESKREECLGRISYVYSVMEEWDLDEFTEVVGDSRQIILSTPYEEINNEALMGYVKKVVYMTRGVDGRVRILGLNPEHLVFKVKRDGVDEESLRASLRQSIVDTDGDGLDDEVETCTNSSQDCVETDPNKRDSDGDGLWDSTELLIAGILPASTPRTSSSTPDLLDPFGGTLDIPTFE